MEVRFVDELGWGFGWMTAEPDPAERCSHALAAEGRVWLVDALDGHGVEERVRALGEPAGVIQLLDRHRRDNAAWAGRLAVPHHVVPLDRIDGAPFELLPVVRSRFWKEAALWWPERRALVCADALGTARYYRAGDERLAVHPLLRWIPPRKRLGIVSPEHVLCGHGEGVHGDETEPAFRQAFRTARRRIPGQIAALVRVEREKGNSADRRSVGT